MTRAISPSAGDFRGPVIGAAGTPYFEPDGVVFCQPATMIPHPSPVAHPDRSARSPRSTRTAGDAEKAGLSDRHPTEPGVSSRAVSRRHQIHKIRLARLFLR